MTYVKVIEMRSPVPTNLDTPKPWTDKQLREFYNSCSGEQKNYIDFIGADNSGTDIADLLAADTTVRKTNRAAAWAYFTADSTRNPYA